jgi:hypothetical protein
MKKLIPLIFVIVPMFFITCNKKPDIPITNIWIKGDSTVLKGQTCKYSVAVLPDNATNLKMAWSSSDESILTISNDGTATAKNYGNVTIYAQSTDGSNVNTSRNIYVLSKTAISIRLVDNLTYYSARFSISFTNGSFSNFSYGLYFNTVPEVDSLHNVGKYKASYPDSVFNFNMLEANTKYYARGYIQNKFGITYSDSVIFQTTELPTGIMGNYMLNNALTNGYVAKCDNWIYFVNQNKRNKLYRIKDDLTDLQKIGSDSAVSSINIIAPYIFYEGGLVEFVMKSKLDGSNPQPIPAPGMSYQVIRSEYPFQILNNEIYYANSYFPPNTYKLYKVSTQGTNLTSLNTTGVQNFCINLYNNKLYYIEYNGSVDIIYTCNLDGSGKVEVYRNNIVHALGIYDNLMFFVDGGNLSSMDLNNLGHIQVLPIQVYNEIYNVANYNIFFSNAADSYKLYKSDINGNSLSKMSDDTVVTEVYVIDDWIYYYCFTNNTSYLYRIKRDGSNHQLVN